MKKLIAIISAIVAFAACAKETSINEKPIQEENQEIKVNFTIGRTNLDSATTKAYVKDGWNTNDVVFVFFPRVASGADKDGKYLELKYDGEKWGYNLNNLTIADLTGGTDSEGNHKMTAIYLPYGSDYSVVYINGGKYAIRKGGAEGPDYVGHLYICEKVPYAFDGETLSGTIHLIAPKTKLTGSDKLVHFDITGGEAGHTYVLNQDYMKPLSFSYIETNVDNACTVNLTVGSMGKDIPGFEDGSYVSFSGVLDESAVSTPPDNYRFVIHDKTSGQKGSAYCRVASSEGHTIITHKYVGLGNISTPTGEGGKWQHITDYYFSASPTKLISFATGNLFATIKKVEDEVEGVYSYAKATSATWAFHEKQYDQVHSIGTTQTIEQSFEVDQSIDHFGWSTDATYYGIHSKDDGTRYYGDFVDWGNTIKDSFTWRTPSSSEISFIFNNRTVSNRYAKACLMGTKYGLILLPDNYSGDFEDFAGMNNNAISWSGLNTFIQIKWNEIESNGAVFLPATGYRKGTLIYQDQQGNAYDLKAMYWTSDANAETTAWEFRVTNTMIATRRSSGRETGKAVRLVRDLN